MYSQHDDTTMKILGRTHIQGAQEGFLALAGVRDNNRLWLLDEHQKPLRSISHEPPETHADKAASTGTFWIDLRDPVTQCVAIGCDWFEPLLTDEHSGLCLAEINRLMLPGPLDECLGLDVHETELNESEVPC